LTLQGLPHTGPESLGADALSPVDHWPEPGYPAAIRGPGPEPGVRPDRPLTLSLTQALQAAAANSFEYQTRKEDIFRSALDLDLERNTFRNIFAAQATSLVSTDGGGDERVSGAQASGSASVTRTLKGGAELGAALAFDLVRLLTSGGSSSLGLAADFSVSIPLLRGSGAHIVAEPLTQAERNVVYALYEFERYKSTFAVDVARQYLSVLQQMDEVRNAEENYRSLIVSARRSRRLGDAGRLPGIQVDQATQNELRARNRWILSEKTLRDRLDAFKAAIGLPPDARVEVDRADLDRLRAPAEQMVRDLARKTGEIGETPAADAPLDLTPPGNEDAGPLEMEESTAVRLALANRLDLRVTSGWVYDAQRRVVVAADGLRAELTLLGSAYVGERRTVETAESPNAKLRFDKGNYAALLTIDLPIERTAERNAFRESYIDLERALRDFQALEDDIKLSIQIQLRTLTASRESLKIQARAVVVARKRVRSINLFLEAGRAQMRDLLEAQEALFTAQNDLTRAAIAYRVAELNLQSDMGVLEVDDQGLWREFSPGEAVHDAGR
jgi:outer membrane protein TolC